MKVNNEAEWNLLFALSDAIRDNVEEDVTDQLAWNVDQQAALEFIAAYPGHRFVVGVRK